MQPQSSFLPSDEQIFERSKDWANFFSRIVKEEDYRDMYYDDIPEVFNDDEEEEDSEEGISGDNTPVDLGGALIKVEKFEASSTSSDDYDHENLLNQTRNIIEERKRKWKESGMDRVLDTFDFNAITDKVGAWLRKTKHTSEVAADLSMHEVHFEKHQYELNSDDSLQSADTAKYILSNRKPRAGSCTKMIIKRFRYVKGKRKELHRKYNCLNEKDLELDEVFSKRDAYSQQRINRNWSPYKYDECITPTSHNGYRQKFPRAIEKPQRCKRYSDISGVIPLNECCITPTNQNLRNVEHCSKTTALTQEAVRKHRSRYRKRRSNVTRKLSTSSSSQCHSDRSTSHARPRFRKMSRKPKICETVDLTYNSSPDDTIKNKTREPTTPKAQLNSKTDPKVGPSSDLTCFLPENIVNSTAITNKNGLAKQKAKTCQLSPVKTANTTSAKAECVPSKNVSSIPKRDKRELSDKVNNSEPQVGLSNRSANSESKTKTDARSSDKRIVLYHPDNETLYNESLNRGCFVLTEDYLKKSVGKKQAQRFIVFNERKFPLKFDLSSTIYFMPPTESENSHRSGSSGGSDDDDEDILNMFGKQGRLVEQTSIE